MTRFLPKEMMPIQRRPMIGWLLQELLAAGVHKAVIVLSSDKFLIQEYLQDEFKQDCDLIFLYTDKRNGPAGAVALARPVIEDPHVLIALPDCFVINSRNRSLGYSSPLVNLLEGAFNQNASAAVLCDSFGSEWDLVPPMYVLQRSSGHEFVIRKTTRSDAIDCADFSTPCGRWFLSKEIFSSFELIENSDQEHYIPELVANAMKEKNGQASLVGISLQPEELSFDAGTWERYEKLCTMVHQH